MTEHGAFLQLSSLPSYKIFFSYHMIHISSHQGTSTFRSSASRSRRIQQTYRLNISTFQHLSRRILIYTPSLRQKLRRGAYKYRAQNKKARKLNSRKTTFVFALLLRSRRANSLQGQSALNYLGSRNAPAEILSRGRERSISLCRRGCSSGQRRRRVGYLIYPSIGARVLASNYYTLIG